MRPCAFVLLAALAPAPVALAGEGRVLVGDPVHGAALYGRECTACHGEAGVGGKSGVSLTDSGRMSLIQDETMYRLIQEGSGTKKPREHAFEKALPFLDTWDVIAHIRSLHMTLDEFFPRASRYVGKDYSVDEHGLKRLGEATGKRPADTSAPVFTFFDFEGEEGLLAYVPQDPIRLDQLKKDKKAGYLVFVRLATKDFEGEMGVAMDAAGKITRLLVNPSKEGAELLNKSLSRFEGHGKKGQTAPFQIAGGASMKPLADDVFPAYLLAMETATMYDRDERERTWADPDPDPDPEPDSDP